MAEAANNKKTHFSAIVIGEPGMGKSTVTYNLAGRPKLEGERKFLDGMDAKGVTKHFEPFKVNLRGEGFVDTLIDTPGLGDQDVKLGEWLGKAEKGFGMVDAIIVCVSETNPRITMGAELVSLMIGGGFLKDAKNKKQRELLHDKIVLVGTKGNLATKKMRKAMPGVAKQFAEKAELNDVGVTYIPVDAGTWKEPDYDETPPLVLDNLREHFRKLTTKIKRLEREGIDTKISYHKIERKKLVSMAFNCLGIKATQEKIEAVAKELGFWRNALSGVGNFMTGNWSEAGTKLSRAGSAIYGGGKDVFNFFLAQKEKATKLTINIFGGY